MERQGWDPRTVAIVIAAVISGVVAILSALIFVGGSDFTIRNILIGGLSIGIVGSSTYFFNRVIVTEVTSKRALDSAEYVRLFLLSSTVWLFPLLAILVAAVGLNVGASPEILIDLIYVIGILIVFIAGFLATYLNQKGITTSILRAAVWSSMFLLLMVIRQIV